jgi:hypothetical protein
MAQPGSASAHDAQTTGIILKYLQDNGFTSAATQLQSEAQLRGSAVAPVPAENSSEPANIEQYQQMLKMGVEGSTANHIVSE